MIALGIVLAVLLLICLLRVGIVAVYCESGVIVEAVIGFFRLRLLPARQKKAGKKTVKKASKREAAESAAKAGKLAGLKNQLPSIRKALSRLRRKLVINELTVYYMAAGDDPASAALTFGGVSAGYGLLLPILENSFIIKKRDLRATVNFNAAEPYIYVRARLSLAVWEVVYIGGGIMRGLIKSGNTRAKIRKAV